MRRRYLLTLVVAGSLTGGVAAAHAGDGAAFAPPQPSAWDAYFAGYGGSYAFKLSQEGGGVIHDRQSGLYGGRFSAAYAFSNGLGVQGDLTHEQYQFLSGPGHDTNGALHLFWRDPNRGLIGVIGQIGQSIRVDPVVNDNISFDRAFAGVEGQAYVGNLTLYGQIAWHTSDPAQPTQTLVSENGWMATAQMRYFVQPDWMVFGKAAYADYRFDRYGTQTNGTAWTLGLGTEYRFENCPLSVFGSAEWSTTSAVLDGGSESWAATKILAGLKLNLGMQTLIERDRHGASLDPLPGNVDVFAPEW